MLVSFFILHSFFIRKDAINERIDTVFIEVSDLNYSTKWYTEILGLTMRWNRNGYAAFIVIESNSARMSPNLTNSH
ncbi:MAG: VOC family protein [Solibacillus sp.]